jgi:hypothetical protein
MINSEKKSNSSFVQAACNYWVMNPGILGSDPKVKHLVFQLRNLALLIQA